MKIEGIRTDQFNWVLKSLMGAGWEAVYTYDDVDAWIDYGEVHLKNGNTLVKFVWDNRTQGEITAEREVEEVRALLCRGPLFDLLLAPV